MPAAFNVTYEVVTPESSENGDTDELGFIAEGVPLRGALEAVWGTRTSHVDGVLCIEASDSEWTSAGWATVYNGGEYLTGAHENRSIHFPEHLTAATRKRLIRIVRRMHV